MSIYCEGFKQEFFIGNQKISQSDPVYIIAEAGVNHNGRMDIARELIDLAVDAKASAVKFQTFKADHLILQNVEKANYQKVTTDKKKTQYEMLKELEVSYEQNIELKNYCLDKGIAFISTPFDEQSLVELELLGVNAYKIASTDLTNYSFIREVAKKSKPTFISTGMSYLSEVVNAVKAFKQVHNELILMQCTGNYPTKSKDVNLAVLSEYKKYFDCIIGYSDHTEGVGASPYAVSAGAKVIEKHFTLDKKMSGPDHRASLSPNELRQLVEEIRLVEDYMGCPIKEPTLAEMSTRASLQKSIVARVDIDEGQVITEEMISHKRTGGKGVSSKYLANIVNTKSKKNYKIDDLIELI